MIRRITLDASVSGRYFFSSSLLRRDLELIWEYLSLGSAYLEYFGQLSREAFFTNVLPYTPLTKLEVFALISIGHAHHKVALQQDKKAQEAPNNTPSTPSASSSADRRSSSVGSAPAVDPAQPRPEEMDPETLDIIRNAFCVEEPFRCSPFLVTFAPKGMDTRPKYERLAKQVETFPQIYLSLSRQLYVARCNSEGLEEFLKHHYQVRGGEAADSSSPWVVVALHPVTFMLA